MLRLDEEWFPSLDLMKHTGIALSGFVPMAMLLLLASSGCEKKNDLKAVMQERADAECVEIAGAGFTANNVDEEAPHGSSCSPSTDCAKAKNRLSMCRDDKNCRVHWQSMMNSVCTKQEIGDEWKLEPIQAPKPRQSAGAVGGCPSRLAANGASPAGETGGNFAKMSLRCSSTCLPKWLLCSPRR